MDSVVFATAAGRPFAELVMSTPVEPERVGMFFRTPADADGSEVRALKPGRPNQYACDFRADAGGTTISFENDDGWLITARLGATGEGRWSATHASKGLQGRARGVSFQSPSRPGLAGRVGAAIRGLFS